MTRGIGAIAIRTNHAICFARILRAHIRFPQRRSYSLDEQSEPRVAAIG